MELHSIFLYLAIILFLARILGDTFGRLGLPPVLGEILVGVLLGKSVLGLIEPSEVLKLLAEIGVILLLFHIGLEADIDQLKKVGISALVVALVGAFTPMLLGTLVSYYVVGLPLSVSLFIGGTLTATSIGITVRVLDDLGKMKERFAQIVLGAAVLDDIFGVIVLAGLYEFSKEGVVHFDALTLLVLYIGVFFIFSPILAQLMARIISLLSEKLRTEDFIPPTVVATIFLFAFMAHEIGSPEILGAFTAGLALSRRFALPFALFLRTDEKLAQKVEHTIMPLVWVLTPIFFVYVGLQLNLKAIDFTSQRFWLLSLLILFVAVIGKVISGFFVEGSLREKLLIGFSMLPRGEVGLIFAEFGRQIGLYDHTLYAVVIFVVAVTTLMAPIVLKFLARE
ncbi:MAG: cation:proton antiporter [Aquificaceae bacterium]|nr:cation:proton antiporter [Aquificaceae bacterium]MDW8066570.1 cation:proton antiporter [Aquificaceae bacterium]MDW8422856.1 cation:proton antiporter [Aquificaceae bacterium]